MSTYKLALMGLLALGLLLPVRADETAVPSFKSSKDRETKEFVTKVFESIVKAARLKTKNYKDVKYEYVTDKDKENRKELHISGTYDGAVISKNIKVTIVIKLDTTNKNAWEVLNIEYKDSLKTTGRDPNTKNIQELIKSFNK
jgi:hypothetical protein